MSKAKKGDHHHHGRGGRRGGAHPVPAQRWRGGNLCHAWSERLSGHCKNLP